MSRIYFHSRDNGTAEVKGTERHLFAKYVIDLFEAAMSMSEHDKDAPESPHWTRNILPTDAYPMKESGARYLDLARLWFKGYGGKHCVRHNGEWFDLWDVQLNTAMAVAGDVLQFCARVHAQCEIHCVIPHHSHRFIHGLIQRGLAAEILREESGWEEVLRLMERCIPSVSIEHQDYLRADKTQSIVLSYSITDPFPSGEWADHQRAWDDQLERIWTKDPLLLLEEKHWRNGYTFGKEGTPNAYQLAGAIHRSRASRMP